MLRMQGLGTAVCQRILRYRELIHNEVISLSAVAMRQLLSARDMAAIHRLAIYKQAITTHFGTKRDRELIHIKVISLSTDVMRQL